MRTLKTLRNRASIYCWSFLYSRGLLSQPLFLILKGEIFMSVIATLNKVEEYLKARKALSDQKEQIEKAEKFLYNEAQFFMGKRTIMNMKMDILLMKEKKDKMDKDLKTIISSMSEEEKRLASQKIKQDK
jgi:hypothetical protein